MFSTSALILASLFATPALAHGSPGNVVVVVSPAAQRAELFVENRTGRMVDLFVDGVRVQSAAPGSMVLRILGGRHTLEARVEGRVISRWTADARPYERVRWAIDAPRVGELRVKNPLPIPVIVEVAGMARTVPAYGDLSLAAVPVGRFDMTVRRTSGQVLDVVNFALGPWDPARLVLSPPSRGLVVVENEQNRPLSLYADGRMVGQVMPHQQTTLEMPLGDVRIDLVDETGRYSQLLESVRLRVDPFEPERIEVRGASAGCSMEHHGYEDEHGHGGERGYGDERGRDARYEATDRDERPMAIAYPSR